MKLLITGANGSLGAYLTRYFAAKGHDIIAVVRRDYYPELHAHARVLQADINQPLAPFPAADMVIHCAALVSDAEPEAALHTTNVLGTRHVLAAATHIPVFVHISSSSVYLPADFPVKETDLPEKPDSIASAYGRSKWHAEQEVLRSEGSLQRYILRPRAVYGPGDRVLLPRICRLKKGPFLLLPGGLQVITSLTHMKNLALVIAQIMQTESVDSEQRRQIFNVADPEPYTLGAVVQTLVQGAESGRVLPVRIPLRPLGWLADLLAACGIHTRLTRFAIDNFRRGQVLDTTALKLWNPQLACTSFGQESTSLIAWMRSVGGVSELIHAAPELPWRGELGE
jgi:nucleoside-diphosphate-sugar epimerase